jgi:multiple sugar transport system substrate-binding protein
MNRTSRLGRCVTAAATASVLALSAACGSSATAPTASSTSGGTSAGSSAAGGSLTTLTALDYYTDEPSHTDTGNRLNACAKTVGATVEHQSVPSGQLNPKILQQASSHTMPDILMVNNPDLPQIAQTGALKPLTSLSVDTSKYLPSVLTTGTFNGQLYGLAPNVNTLALFYNKKLLKAAGVAVPTTWPELSAAAKKLTKGSQYGFAYSAASGTEGTWTFIPFLWSNGGSQLKLTDPAAVDALTFYTGMVADGSVSKSVVNWVQADVNDQFIAGKAAMMINGPWQIPTISKTAGLDWGVTTIPVPKAGDTPVAPLGGELWTVPVTSDAHEKLAASIVMCLNQPATQLSMAKSNNTVPSDTAAAAQLAKDVPSMAAIVKTVTSAKSLTSDSGLKWNDVDSNLAVAIQTVITGKADAKTALAAAQQAINAGS